MDVSINDLAAMDPDAYLKHLEKTRHFIHSPYSDPHDTTMLDHAQAKRFSELVGNIGYHLYKKDRLEFCSNAIHLAQPKPDSALSRELFNNIVALRDEAALEDDVDFTIHSNITLLSFFAHKKPECTAALDQNFSLYDNLGPVHISVRLRALSFFLNSRHYRDITGFQREWCALIKGCDHPETKLAEFNIVARGTQMNQCIKETISDHAENAVFESIKLRHDEDGENSPRSPRAFWPEMIDNFALYKTRHDNDVRLWHGWTAQIVLNQSAGKTKSERVGPMDSMKSCSEIERRRYYHVVRRAQEDGEKFVEIHALKLALCQNADTIENFNETKESYGLLHTATSAYDFTKAFMRDYKSTLRNVPRADRDFHDTYYTALYAELMNLGTAAFQPTKQEIELGVDPTTAVKKMIGLHSFALKRNADHPKSRLNHYAANKRDQLLNLCLPALKRADMETPGGGDLATATHPKFKRGFDLN